MTTPKPQMPDLKDVIFDLAHNRAHYIDRYIERRSKHREYNVTNKEIDEWTTEAVQQWRELYPSLQAIWSYHEAKQREAKEARA